MEFYIGLGGIGCKALYDFAKTKNLSMDCCYYLDSDPSTSFSLPDANIYLVKGLSGGSGAYRNIGRSAVLHEIYCGKLRDFFENIFNQDEVSLRIITTSFGGFGGGAAAIIMDYLQANTYDRQKSVCEVYAISESFVRYKVPSSLMKYFESNTIDFVSDFSDRLISAPSSEAMFHFSQMFISQCKLWLLDSSKFTRTKDYTCADILRQALEMTDEQLEEIHVIKNYAIKPNRIKKPTEVFISYSSKDKAIADKVTKAIEDKGIRCWIAPRDMTVGSYPIQITQQIRSAQVFLILLTKNSMESPEFVLNELDRAFNRLKDGLHIVPVSLLDAADIKEEFWFYLCRQQIFSIKEPPLEERINEIALLIKEIIE